MSLEMRDYDTPPIASRGHLGTSTSYSSKPRKWVSDGVNAEPCGRYLTGPQGCDAVPERDSASCAKVDDCSSFGARLM